MSVPASVYLDETRGAAGILHFLIEVAEFHRIYACADAYISRKRGWEGWDEGIGHRKAARIMEIRSFFAPHPRIYV